MEIAEPDEFRQIKPLTCQEIAFGLTNLILAFGGLILVSLSTWLLQVIMGLSTLVFWNRVDKLNNIFRQEAEKYVDFKFQFYIPNFELSNDVNIIHDFNFRSVILTLALLKPKKKVIKGSGQQRKLLVSIL